MTYPDSDHVQVTHPTLPGRVVLVLGEQLPALRLQGWQVHTPDQDPQSPSEAPAEPVESAGEPAIKPSRARKEQQ